MESKFYIGQKVVALADYEKPGVFKKGDEFTVLDIRKSCCTVDIRIFSGKFSHSMMECYYCGKREIYNTDPYFRQERFAPIQEISNMTFEEAIELVTEKQTA